ncbi:hypothetical protein A0H81_14660 [Grifola frondosa]|uniref:Uncharacterized protein n=1 Tax=Grifola frondosa TaxID=5627 RepID=A0A1C7LL18_GRIFR|nr:hypothetical protein A0H81_14660 [Grifola frondosa]
MPSGIDQSYHTSSDDSEICVHCVSGPLNTHAIFKGLIGRPVTDIKHIYFNKESSVLSLQEALGMEDDVDKFLQLIGLMRRVGDKYFNWKTPYTSLKKDIKELYKEEVLAGCPDLTCYEGGWPVDHYMRIIMDRECRSMGNRRFDVQSMGARRHDGATHKKARYPDRGRPGPGRDSFGMVKRPATNVSAHKPYKANTGIAISTHFSQKAPEGLSALQPMLELLQTVHVPLNDALRIARTFKSIGMKDAAWMRVFAHIEQRHDLLMKMFKRGELSELEVHVMKEILNRCRKERK